MYPEYPIMCQRSLNRQTAEKMCEKKLRKICHIESKLCQTVLVKNTLIFVQTSDNVTFHETEEAEYEPCLKRHCSDISTEEDIDIDDIDDILNEMFLPLPLLSNLEESSYDWPVSENQSEGHDIRDIFDRHSDDSVVPGNDVLEHDEEYINELFRNRNNCTVRKLTKHSEHCSLQRNITYG